MGFFDKGKIASCWLVETFILYAESKDFPHTYGGVCGVRELAVNEGFGGVIGAAKLRLVMRGKRGQAALRASYKKYLVNLLTIF